MAQENKELDKKIEEFEAQNKEYLEGWKRERAEFLNYKKEEMERINGILKYCSEETILKILPILDNFYIAEKEMGPSTRSARSGQALSTDSGQGKWVEGFLNIKKQIEEFLKSQGVEEIKTMGDPSTSSGQVKFDPNFHEAVEGSGNTEQESDVIIEEIQKGYTLNGKVIRPAKVKVSK